MCGLLVSAVFAAVMPTQYIDSVGIAAYWLKKDERGRGDRISEEAKPRRYPAFALSGDTFILADPAVRAKHLDKVEFWYRGERYAAKEVARSMDPDTVTLKTDKAVAGVKPLVFAEGEPSGRITWNFSAHDALEIECGGVGTNDGVKVIAETGRRFRTGKPNSLLVDRDGNPVGLDFGNRLEVEGKRFTCVPPAKYSALAADHFEKSAAAIETRVAAASLPVTIHLEQDNKDARQRNRWSSFGDDPEGNDIDAIGFVFGRRVLVPSKLDGEGIARFSKAEATFADGTKTNLVFAGALAEWRAIVFDLPEGTQDRAKGLSVYHGDAYGLDGGNGWIVSVEFEGGRVIPEVTWCKFRGIELIRGAKTVAACDSNLSSWEYRRLQHGLVITADGEVATLALVRRFGRQYEETTESIAPEDIEAMLAGSAFSSEFVPRGEEDRNRLVWLGVESVRLTDALAREKQAQSFTGRYSRPPLVTEIYPGSPAEKAGLKVGDILLSYRRGSEREREFEGRDDSTGRDWNRYFELGELYSSFGFEYTPWPNVENSINKELTKLGAGTRIAVVYVRDGKRTECEVALEAAPQHYRNARKSRNRALGVSVKDMTFEVRRYFKFSDTDPGVVLAKIKPGSPAAVAGLKMYELVTEVNGAKVKDAKDFAAKIKGRSDLVFAVRRLAQTRMVKIHIDTAAAEQ